MKKTTFKLSDVNLTTIEGVEKFLEEYDVNAKNENGETALMLASYYEHLEVVKYLIKHKADVKAGQTPLDMKNYLIIDQYHDGSKLLKRIKKYSIFNKKNGKYSLLRKDGTVLTFIGKTEFDWIIKDEGHRPGIVVWIGKQYYCLVETLSNNGILEVDLIVNDRFYRYKRND